MIELFLTMAGLGLAAVDPIGIGLVLILLTQKQALLRSAVFLLGSCSALILMGFVFAHSVGAIIIRTEQHHYWLAPSFQIAMGILLSGYSLYSLVKLRSMPRANEPPKLLVKYTEVRNVTLFLFGFILVILQSIVDGVFIVAMVRAGSLHPSMLELLIALVIYALAAVLLQLIIVAVYAFSPLKKRELVLNGAQNLLNKYGERVVIALGFLLGAALITNSMLIISGRVQI